MVKRASEAAGKAGPVKQAKGEQVEKASEGALAPTAPVFKNKEKVLVLSTRGITMRYRHLMNDIINMLPHCKKDSKLDTKNDRGVINEVADMKSCTAVAFFEVRKKKDLFLWLSKSPEGPSVKFLVQNVHTMAELKLSGNHLKGARPVLSFHKVVVPMDKKKPDPSAASLVEVGPRTCMNPIKIFDGSFGGKTLFENTDYISPNAVRAAAKRQAAGKYKNKVGQKERRKEHVAANPLPVDELDAVFK
eukprot:gene21638-28647_t